MKEEYDHTKLTGTAAVQWKHIQQAVGARQWEFASVMLNEVIGNHPRCVEARMLLRKATIEKLGVESARKKSAMGPHWKTKRLIDSDPESATEVIEKQLANTPCDPDLNYLLFQACEKLGWQQTAEASMRLVMEHRPDKAEILHVFAEYLVSKDRPSEANKIYNIIVSHHQNDHKAQRGIRDTAALKSLQDNQGQPFEKLIVPKEKEELTADALPAQLESRIEALKEKDDVESIKERAGLHERLGEYEAAAAAWNQVSELLPFDSSLRSKAFAAKRAAIDEAIRTADEEDAAELVEKRKANLLEDLELKIRNHPSDPQFRFDYAKVLQETGRLRDALREYQKAKANPHLKIQCSIELGRCLRDLSMFDMAEEELNEAIAKLDEGTEPWMEAIYELASVFGEQDQHVKALTAFKRIYRYSTEFRDVAEKVEESYAPLQIA